MSLLSLLTVGKATERHRSYRKDFRGPLFYRARRKEGGFLFEVKEYLTELVGK